MLRVFSSLRRFLRLPQYIVDAKLEIAHQTEILNQQLVDAKLEVAHQTDILNQRLIEMKKAIDALASGALKPVLGQLPNVRVLDFPLELPYPADLARTEDDDAFLAALTQHIEFERCAQAINGLPRASLSLISAHSQALLYCLVRLLQPRLVVEIGTYEAATAQIIAAALAANGVGQLHTIDPFGAGVPPIIAAWPSVLQTLTTFFPETSMSYFANLAKSGQRADLILIDGNHDYEYALFDLEASARSAAPDAIVLIDNIDQGGPFFAARDFLARRTDWREIGGSILQQPVEAPFALRSQMNHMNFAILKGPSALVLDGRPFTPGQIRCGRTIPRNLRMVIEAGAPGTLHLQTVIRIFGASRPAEFAANEVLDIAEAGTVVMPLGGPEDNVEDVQLVTAEPWFRWDGTDPLRVTSWALI
ncbi:MAG: class I SAM-dependent methyltransferase [Stellaceae bacterium]